MAAPYTPNCRGPSGARVPDLKSTTMYRSVMGSKKILSAYAFTSRSQPGKVVLRSSSIAGSPAAVCHRTHSDRRRQRMYAATSSGPRVFFHRS